MKTTFRVNGATVLSANFPGVQRPFRLAGEVEIFGVPHIVTASISSRDEVTYDLENKEALASRKCTERGEG